MSPKCWCPFQIIVSQVIQGHFIVRVSHNQY